MHKIKLFFTFVTCVGSVFVQDCNIREVPYTLSVDSNGKAKLRCQKVNCVENGKDDVVKKFPNIHIHKQKINSFKKCSDTYKSSCSQPLEWVSGVYQISKILQLKCCKYAKMKDATYQTEIYLKNGQNYQTGYHSDENGRQTSFDLIKNITMDNQGYHLWIYRMRCIPPAKESKKAAKRHGSSTGQGSQSVPRIRGRGNGGSGSGGCFSPDTKSFVKDKGWVQMKDLKVSDLVLTVFGDNVLSYQPITCFFHKDPSQWATYVTIHTDSGNNVTLTPAHLIYVTNCHNNSALFKSFKTKFASEVQSGDCLLLATGNKLVKTKAIKVSWAKIKGVYSPMTVNGVIVTNGIVSSCFSFVKDDILLRSVYTVLFKWQKILQSNLNNFSNLFFDNRSEIEFVEIPSFVEFFLNIFNEILPAFNKLKLF